MAILTLNLSDGFPMIGYDDDAKKVGLQVFRSVFYLIEGDLTLRRLLIKDIRIRSRSEIIQFNPFLFHLNLLSSILQKPSLLIVSRHYK